ncbi:unnamed protein product [Cochlearia groenlandica]
MGKSGGRKKKTGTISGGGGGGANKVNSSEPTAPAKPIVNGVASDFDATIYLKRAHDLKEEGNKKFQAKDFAAALDYYTNGLNLIPKTHADRAVFHSNRAACLMQMKPIDYDNVIAECTMALQVQPGFTRALLRRARALEAVGKYELAVKDVNLLLGSDPNHKDATEMSRRLMISNEKSDKEKTGSSEDPEMKELEMDDWLFDFAQLFRSHVGIDPDAHIDLHELGMELCSEALEETVTSEEAQPLFDKAAAKFQEVAALAFFNWGNVHMCAARKRIPLEESAEKEVVAGQLQTAYEWVKERYTLAKEKYEHALSIKPDFYEGLLALGQQQFEMAKLHWSFALAQKIDLSNWDPAETLNLFDSAEEKMKAATEMWEKLEEQRTNDLKNPSSNKKEEVSKRRKKQGEGGENGEASEAVTAAEAAEQAIAMRSQIHLFWGNMLFERSQVECKIGGNGWKKNLDSAVERFKLAGASEADISSVVEKHCSNESEAAAVEGEGEEKKVAE